MSRRSTRNVAATEIMGVPSMPTHVMPSISAMGALPKPPKPPEKPLIPYMRYSRKVWDEVKTGNTGNTELKLGEVGRIIGQQWRELPAIEKQPYIDEYEAEKIEHLEQLKQYHNSPAYQAYLHARTRAEAMEAAEAFTDKDDAYMSIEPTDDGADDSDLSCSVKHVAAARFQRNHRLINDILGETTPVPGNRSIVTSTRLGILKNQVQSLELHRKKLENELVHLEDTFDEKKRKLIAQSDSFEREMKRLKAITPQEYYQEHKMKLQQAAPPTQEKQVTHEKRKKDETAPDANKVLDKNEEANRKDIAPQGESGHSEEKIAEGKRDEKPNDSTKGDEPQMMETQEDETVAAEQSEITKPDGDTGEESQQTDAPPTDDNSNSKDDAKTDCKDSDSNSSNVDGDATASADNTKDGDEGK